MRHIIVIFSTIIAFSSWGQIYTMPSGSGSSSATTCIGTFYDNGGLAGNYGNNQNSTYTFCAPAGSCVSINFTDIDLAKADYLTIHDGPTNASPQIGGFGVFNSSVANATGTFTATTGCLTVWFTSGNSGVDNGWTATVSCTAGCIPGCTDPAGLNYDPVATYNDGSCTYPAPDYTMSTTGINGEYVGNCLVADCGPSTFTDDGGFGGNYSDAINNIYRVFCPEIAGNCMQVTFNDVDFYSTLDYLTIKNGPTQNSTDIDQITSTDNGTTPFSYTSTDPSGCLTFRTYTSAANNAGGWSAILECVPCAGGPNGTDNNDCVNLTPLCSAATVGGNASGPGIAAEGCTGSDCPAGGENHTNWYTFTAQTSGTLNITITPQDATDDYDFAIYGPNVTCGALGSPIRCTDAGATGTTGLTSTASDNTESVTGDKFLATMNVTAGESFILVVDEWSPNAGSGYDLSFSGTASLDCTILPVELRLFDASYNEQYQTVDVTWVTETEIDCDHFEIQKSIDGTNYRKIGELKGGGTTTNHRQYIYIDETPQTGVNYYRLEQFDINGESKYSEVRSLNILDLKFDVLSVSPNPSNGEFDMVFNSYSTGIAQFEISNYHGEIILSDSFNVTKGGNHKAVSLTNKPGVYLISLIIDSRVYHQRIVIE